MDTPQQAQLRRHLGELRHATRGIGRDFAIEFENLDQKIARLGTLSAHEAKYALLDIEDGFLSLGSEIERDVRRLPHEVAQGLTETGAAIGSGAQRLAEGSRDALETAGHRTKEAGKNAFATMAGMRRTPMREWRKETESTD